MELYVLAGGQLDSVNRWLQDLNSQFLPIYDKDGKQLIVDNKLMHRRLLVAPIQLYKIAFNKENLDEVLSMVCPTPYVEDRYPTLKYAVKLFRKILGIKEAPAPKKLNPFLQPNNVDKAVFVIPLGTKEDGIDDNGNELI